MLFVYKPFSTLSGNLKDNRLGVRDGLGLGLCLSFTSIGLYHFPFFFF